MKSIFKIQRIELVLRVFVALYMFRYGQVKLFAQQFKVGLDYYKFPIEDLDGLQFLWAFFAYSKPFVFIIGLLQVLGGFLFLWNRTKLFGVVILVPILLNILLMDIFYAMPNPEILTALVNDVFYLLVIGFVCYNERAILFKVFNQLYLPITLNFSIEQFVINGLFILFGIVIIYITLNEGVKKIILGINYSSVLFSK